MNRDPGFGHPITAAVGAEVLVVLTIFIAAIIVASMW